MPIYIQGDSIVANGKVWIEVRPSNTPKEAVAQTVALTNASVSSRWIPGLQAPNWGPQAPTGTTQAPATSNPPKEVVSHTVSLTNATISSTTSFMSGPGVQAPTGTTQAPATSNGPKEVVAATVALTNATISAYLQNRARPYSLTSVRIINVPGPPPPNGLPPARGPVEDAPVPPWLKRFLSGLRLYMRRTGTIRLAGFQFDASELSKLAGVPVRELS